MRKLLAFGDSYTYGHGLNDCWIEKSQVPGQSPSAFAWPSILAKDLEYNVDNCSLPGMSNLAILNRILNTEFDDNSLCIIMWSYPYRDMIFGSNYSPTLENVFNKKIDKTHLVTHVGGWMDNGLSKNWMLAHNDTDLKIRSWMHIHHANLYLDSIKVPHFNFFIDFNTLKTHKPDYVKIPYKDINLSVDYFLDRASDGDHPGPLTHEKISRDIKQCLIEDSLL